MELETRIASHAEKMVGLKRRLYGTGLDRDERQLLEAELNKTRKELRDLRTIRRANRPRCPEDEKRRLIPYAGQEFKW